MVNYLSRDYFMRFQVSTRTKLELSPLTVKMLQSITNRVKVTLFYDKEHEPLYATVADLLNQYSMVNSKISVQTIDYLRDPGAALKFKTEYKLPLIMEKNLILFDCAGKTLPVPADALTQFVLEQDPNEKELKFTRKRAGFEGEKMFSAALLAVTSPKANIAYFLGGHREHSIESNGDYGYSKLALMLEQNAIRVQTLSLLGTNPVPADCSLLVIAGPANPLFDGPGAELDKIEQYLEQGGRLLVLFDTASISKETGLEKTGLDKLLAKWGIEVGHSLVRDADNSVMGYGVVVRSFDQKHPLVNPLLNSGLYLVEPRTIAKLKSAAQAADAPRVEELAFTGPRALTANVSEPRSFPLIVAVEKGAIKNVLAEGGSTRIVVVGDSIFLANAQIDSAANRDFAGYAANWLLDRTQLLEAIGPRPLKEYRIVMSKNQLLATQWILLGGMPGAALLVGGLVWLRRRR
jgi:hypothetical protein